jgi:hypothetical protein
LSIVAVVYLIFGIVIFVAVLIIVLAIAGKDILLAVKRRFNSRGADVWIVNLNRNVSRYYLSPKEGIFRIKSLPYVANPQKIVNVADEERKKIFNAMAERKEKLEERLAKLTQQKESIQKLCDDSKNESQKSQLNAFLAHFDKIIEDLKNRREIKEENYFLNRRPFYLYLEGDPLPKNLHDYQSIMDSQILDNIIVRIKTAPPEANLAADFKKMKIILLGVLLFAAAAAYFAYRNNQALEVLLKNFGLKIPGILGG